MHRLLILIVIFGVPVSAWYFIRSAVASGVRAGRRDDMPTSAPDDKPDAG